MSKKVSEHGLKGIKSHLLEMNQIVKQISREDKDKILEILKKYPKNDSRYQGYEFLSWGSYDWYVEIIDAILARYERERSRVKSAQKETRLRERYPHTYP